MHPKIQAWLDAEKQAEDAANLAQEVYEQARGIQPEWKLRPATPADIVVGAVIWYPDPTETYWNLVQEVLHPSDDWKAYCSHDGCRYGLHGAYVEAPADNGGE